MICQVCLDCISTTFFESETGHGAHHKNFTSFKNSIDEGCYPCNRLWTVLKIDERRIVSEACANEHHVSKLRPSQTLPYVNLSTDLKDIRPGATHFLLLDKYLRTSQPKPIVLFLDVPLFKHGTSLLLTHCLDGKYAPIEEEKKRF